MESNQNQSSSLVPKIFGGVVAILLCCACVVIIAAGVIIYQAYQQVPTNNFPTLIPPVDAETSTPQSVPTLDRTPTDSNTLDVLNNTLVPENDPYELGCRLKGKCNVSTTVPGKEYKVGDKEQFWITNNDTAEN